MLPKVIMHNSISVDGSLTGFEPNLGIHYQIAGSYQADIHLIGSRTAKTGIDMFTEEVPPEEETDFVKPEISPDDKRPFWVIPDTRGILKNLLHVYRRFEYCKDVIILISKATPEEYIIYLQKRSYDYFVAGEDHVDYRKAFEILYERYHTATVLTDAGKTLNSILLEQGLINEISFFVAPAIVGKAGLNVFGSFDPEKIGTRLKLLKNEVVESNYVCLLYEVFY